VLFRVRVRVRVRHPRFLGPYMLGLGSDPGISRLYYLGLGLGLGLGIRDFSDHIC